MSDKSRFDTHFVLAKGDSVLSVKTFRDSGCDGSLGIHIHTSSGVESFSLASPDELRFLGNAFAELAGELADQEV